MQAGWRVLELYRDYEGMAEQDSVQSYRAELPNGGGAEGRYKEGMA
jgi:hypothetical protein